jgi:hypothetical protein
MREGKPNPRTGRTRRLSQVEGVQVVGRLRLHAEDV